MDDPTPPTPPEEPAGVPLRRRVLAATALAGVVGWAVVSPGARGPLLIVTALVALIVVHEAGHFLAARATGMRPTEFFVGFGPRLWSFRRNGTEFGVKAIPAGGYVRLPGMSTAEEVPPELERYTYRAATTPRRLLVVSAGVLVNLAVGFLIFTVAFAAIGEQVTGTSRVLEYVDPDSPAERAGLAPGDEVLAVGGEEVEAWSEVATAIYVSPGEELAVRVARDGTTRDLVVVPEDADGIGRIGVGPATEVAPVSPADAVGLGATSVWEITRGTLVGLGGLLTPAGIEGYVANFTGEATPTQQAERPRSLVGIVDAGTGITSRGAWEFLLFVGFISVALGVFNALPLLPLDGGHAVIAAYEGVAGRLRGRRVHASPVWLARAGVAVLGLLLLLVVSAAVLDVGEILRR